MIKEHKIAIKRDICGNISLFSDVRNPDPHNGNIKNFWNRDGTSDYALLLFIDKYEQFP